MSSWCGYHRHPQARRSWVWIHWPPGPLEGPYWGLHVSPCLQGEHGFLWELWFQQSTFLRLWTGADKDNGWMNGRDSAKLNKTGIFYSVIWNTLNMLVELQIKDVCQHNCIYCWLKTVSGLNCVRIASHSLEALLCRPRIWISQRYSALQHLFHAQVGIVGNRFKDMGASTHPSNLEQRADTHTHHSTNQNVCLLI